MPVALTGPEQEGLKRERNPLRSGKSRNGERETVRGTGVNWLPCASNGAGR
jgi:hypothetical protein